MNMKQKKLLQTIKFSLDEKGGKNKSEAGIMTKGNFWFQLMNQENFQQMIHFAYF